MILVGIRDSPGPTSDVRLEARSDLKGEIAGVRSELKIEIGAARSELRTLIEATRGDIQLLAEHLAGVMDRIHREN